MDRFEKISEILSNPKQDKLSFLSQILDNIFTTSDIPEPQESTYKKAILYVTCWILLPQTSIPSLPTEFSSVYSLLDTDTSSLFPKFLEKFKESYNDLSEIICNDTLLTICLTIPIYNEQFFSFLRAEHCISPLMWLLTYSPAHLKLASEMLPRAISKKGGVKELLECFARGDDSWKLKNLYIKILKKTPRTGKKEYVESVVEQVVEIMTEYNCDKITENAMEEVGNFFLQNFPDNVMPYIKTVGNSKLNASQIVKFFRIFAQYLPPNCLILFGISDLFGWFMQLWMHVHSTILQIRNEVLTIFVQFFVYWELAGENFTEFIESNTRQYSFSENSSNEVEYTKIPPEPLGPLSSLFSIFPCFSEASGASIIFPKIFSALLQKYNESQNPSLINCLGFLLESVEPIFLVNMPKNIESLLKSCVLMDNEELNFIVLQILLYTPEEQLSKEFLISISKKVLEVKNCGNSELAELGYKVNEKISGIIENHKGVEETKVKCEETWVKELESEEAYLNAIGLHKLAMSVKEGVNIPWERLKVMLEKEDFVFGEALKCYIKVLEVQCEPGIIELIQVFHTGVDGIKLRTLEIFFFWSKNSKSALKPSKQVLNFLDQVTLENQNEEIVDSAIIVTSQIVRRLKSAFFPYLSNCIHNILNRIKLANSRLTANQELPKHLPSTLILLRKLIKHCSHTEEYLEDIKSVLSIFKSLYLNTNSNLTIILQNLLIELDTKLMESLD